MKKRFLPPLIGLAAGAVILAAFWLMDSVFHVSGFSFQDGAFWAGVILFLLGLIALTRGGRSATVSAGISSPSNATAQVAYSTMLSYQEQKILSDPKLARRRKGPSLSPAGIAMAVAGLLDLAAFGLTMLF